MAKLLMISGDRALAGGKHGAFYNTLEEFHRYWERIDVLVPRVASPEVASPEVKPQGYFDNVFIHASPWPLWLQPWWIYKKGQALFKEHKFDLITVHEYPPFYNGLGARWLWNKIKVPYVLELMHIPGYPRSGSAKEWFYKRLTRWLIKWDANRAKAIRVINKKETPDFLVNSGIARERLIYIPAFYIDLDIFRPLAEEKKYDLIFVGRLAKNKGIHLLLEAVKLSISNYQFPIKCLIVGNGPLKESIKMEIEKCKLEKFVTLHGWAKDSGEVARLINQAKLLIMPSYNEGGPRVVLEAMACGVPVLATPVGIVPDLLKNSPGGEITSWEPKDMAQKAERLLNNPNKLSEYRLKGLEMAKQFEKKTAIKNYAEELRKII